jgi:hypothetical protein
MVLAGACWGWNEERNLEQARPVQWSGERQRHAILGYVSVDDSPGSHVPKAGALQAGTGNLQWAPALTYNEGVRGWLAGVIRTHSESKAG